MHRRWFGPGIIRALFTLSLAGLIICCLSSGSANEALAQAPERPNSNLHQSSLRQSPQRSSLQQSSRSAGAKQRDAQALLSQLPLIFEPNQGQSNSGAKFLSHGAGYGLSLDATGAVLGIQTSDSSRGKAAEQFVRMKFVGANPKAEIAGSNQLPGKSNYFVGNDPHQWRTGIPQFARVRYRDVYPGIDLVFYGNQGHLEYDFRIAPGADPSRAELQFEGAGKLEIKDGDLLVAGNTKNGPNLRMRKPEIYQRAGDRRIPVEGHFVLGTDNRLSFEVGDYDRSRELIIDPALDFSSYFGIITAGTPVWVAVNNDGNIYLSGSTTSDTGFPTSLATPTTLGTNHVFVAKINPSSPPSLTYLTFLGGNGTDTSEGLGVDLGGNAYVAGNTTSSTFPTTSLAYQAAPLAKGSQCASISCTSLFVSALDSTGSGLNYSSYVSGNGDDLATGVAIDTSKDVFITGTTTSNNAASSTVAFPATLLPVPFQPSSLASIQFFVTKVNTAVAGIGGIAYSTYFGGNTPAPPATCTGHSAGCPHTGGGIVVDSTGNIYFSGTTNFYNSGSGVFGNSGNSGDFPILDSYQPCLDTVPPVTLTNPNACSAPATTPYPTDAFMAKINPLGGTGAQLLYSTYLGGSVSDTSTSIAIDSTYVYITGSTNSPDFYLPPTELAYQSCLNNPGVVEVSTASCPATNANTDAYIARFTNPSLSTSGTPNFVGLSYFSYLGGSGNDAGNSIAVDTANDALVTGYTSSTNFPFTPTFAIQTVLNGAQNAFFAHLNTNANTSVTGGNYATYFGGNGTDDGTSIAVDINLNTYFAGSTTSTTGTFQVPDALQGTFNSPGPDAFAVKLGTQSDLTITFLQVSPNGTAAAGNQVTITYTVANNGPDVATGINVLGQVPSGVTFNNASVSGSTSGTSGVAGTCSAATGGTNITCQIPALQAGSGVTLTFVVTPLIPGTFEATATVSDPTNTNTSNTATAPFSATSFTVSISPSSQTVAAGQPAQYYVVVTPTQGVFGANVSLTCGQLPAGASCNFATSTINLSSGAGSASTVLNLSTTAQPVTTASNREHRPLYAFWLAVPGMAFLGLAGTGRKRRRGMLLGLIALMAFFTMTLLQPACSTPKTQPTVSGTPSAIYPLTLTATSGTLTKTASFGLTVVP
ncbi:MAG: SBBP repeat-containing protein [Candidatus Sulfotelmatobacter sp.]